MPPTICFPASRIIIWRRRMIAGWGCWHPARRIIEPRGTDWSPVLPTCGRMLARDRRRRRRDEEQVSAELHTSVRATAIRSAEWPENRIRGHSKSQSNNPIILLSACPRSGSNYLEALLSLHPQCRKSRFPEDFFLANSETLLSFCRSVADSWDDWWSPRLGGPSQLAR